MMYQGSILVLLQMVRKEVAHILVAEQGEAEWPYCALLDAEGMQDSSPTPCDGSRIMVYIANVCVLPTVCAVMTRTT